MQGWFQKLFNSRETSASRHGNQSTLSKGSVTSPKGFPPASSTQPLLSAPSGIPPSKPQPQNILRSELRLKKKYDLFVCHSAADVDAEEATRLVLYLEAEPRGLRCFLWHRDACLGAAVFTESSRAVQQSHMQALLITPGFVKDDWCHYVMHQSLAEGPMGNTIVPLVRDLSREMCPVELRHYFYVDLSRSLERGYDKVHKTVLAYLETKHRRELTFQHHQGITTNVCESG